MSAVKTSDSIVKEITKPFLELNEWKDEGELK